MFAALDTKTTSMGRPITDSPIRSTVTRSDAASSRSKYSTIWALDARL